MGSHEIPNIAVPEQVHAVECDSSEGIFNSGIFVKVVLFFITFRILQRVYYFSRGHKQLLYFNPRVALEKWFMEEGVQVTNHNLFSSIDGVLLTYRRIGTGKRLVLLANGVGTALYMWLSFFSF